MHTRVCTQFALQVQPLESLHASHYCHENMGMIGSRNPASHLPRVWEDSRGLVALITLLSRNEARAAAEETFPSVTRFS